MRTTYKDLNERLTLLEQNLDKTICDMLANGDILKSIKLEMARIVEQEIKAQIRNMDLHSLVGDLVRQKTDDNLKPIITEVIEKTLTKLNTTMERQARISREIAYSIDSEIRHSLMKSSLTYDTEKRLKDTIMMALNKTAFKQLEMDG